MTSIRLSLFFAAYFMIVGVQLPFWPVWLQSRGMSAAEIGFLLAAATWLKIANPLIAGLVDRSGERKRPIIALAVLALGAAGLFMLPGGFWYLLGVSAFFALAWSTLNPLADSLTMMTSQQQNLDYGRIRLWGSVTFVLAAVGGGRWLAGRSEDWILWLILGGLVLTVLAALALPDSRVVQRPTRRPKVRRFLRAPSFLLFLGAAALTQASHVVLYGFGTIHWRTVGLSDDVIGLLWAEGVIAEIILFAYSAWVLKKIGPVGLLIVAAGAGALRWAVMPLTSDVYILALLQPLHGATFGAAHLGAIHFIARAAPPELSATAQSLYSSLALGIAFGVAMPLAGLLYGTLGALAYAAMSVMCLAGLGLALVLWRRWDGGEISA